MSPMMKIQEIAPIAPTIPMKARAPTKEPVAWTMNPVASGTTKPDKSAKNAADEA